MHMQRNRLWYLDRSQYFWEEEKECENKNNLGFQHIPMGRRKWWYPEKHSRLFTCEVLEDRAGTGEVWWQGQGHKPDVARLRECQLWAQLHGSHHLNATWVNWSVVARVHSYCHLTQVVKCWLSLQHFFRLYSNHPVSVFVKWGYHHLFCLPQGVTWDHIWERVLFVL